jgi:agmatinase
MAPRAEHLPPSDAGLFGASTTPQQADLVVIGVPWEPTVSYGRGTSGTPAALPAASHQIDLYDPFLGDDFDEAAAMPPLREDWIALNASAVRDAAQVMDARGQLDAELEAKLQAVNDASERLNRQVQQEVARWLEAGKSVGVLGGDHSCPLGSMLAHAEHCGPFGVLHLDAHLDLREAFEGFVHSHGSIMFNLLRASERVEALVSVGIRDYCIEEAQLAADEPRVTAFYDRDLARARFQGRTWDDLCAEIVAALPQQVYVSLDIDGLDPALCPHTGTPVPGGLGFEEARYLLESVVASGRRIIGFDLVEVAPDPENPNDEWDLNVGARVLHKLCTLTWMGRRT